MVKIPPASAGDKGLIPGLSRSSGGRKWQLTPVFLLGKSHGQRILTGYTQFMGLQRVGHDLVTKQQRDIYVPKTLCKSSVHS